MSRDPPATRVQRRSVPAFALYGESAAPGADMLHLESIASRSQRYRWEIDAHLHRGLHQVLWLQSGGAQVRLDDAQQAVQSPAVIVIPPGVVHAFRFAPHSVGCVLTLSAGAMVQGDAQAAAQALRQLFVAPRVLALQDDEELPRFASLFQLLADEFAAPRPAGSPVPLWLARVVVWRLAELVARREQAAGPMQREHQALFTRFVVLVEAHHTEHWAVARYAGELGLTAERLNRLARAEAGRSALDLVHDRLSREACRRLTYVAAPISRLAYELGFEDPAYFCRFFKRRIGCSPRAYRQRSAS